MKKSESYAGEPSTLNPKSKAISMEKSESYAGEP